VPYHHKWRPKSGGVYPPIMDGITFLVDLCRSTTPIYSAAGTTAPSTLTVDGDGTLIDNGGLIKQATANVGRMSYSQKGILVEPTRANVGIQCHDYTNAAWVVSNTTDLVVTNTSVTCPDGTARTTNAIRCDVADGSIMQTVTSASAAHSCGFWIKRITGSGAINITINGGSTWTAVTVTSAWTRVKRENITVTNPQFGIQIHVAGDVVALDFGQLEVGAALSSDIPTTTAAVTRTEESLLYPTTGNLSATAGSILVVYTPNAATTATNQTLLDSRSGAPLNLVGIARTTTGVPSFVAYSGGAEVASLQATSAVSAGTTYAQSASWALNDFRLYVNGGDEKSDTSGAVPASLGTTFGAGTYSGYMSFGTIALLIIANRAWSAAEHLALANWARAKVGAL
jgi:hypothetical protein